MDQEVHRMAKQAIDRRVQLQKQLVRLLLSILIAVASCSCGCRTQPKLTKPARSADPVIAEVLGVKVRKSQEDALAPIVLKNLIQEYARVNGLEPSRSEIDTFIAATREKELRRRKELERHKEELIEGIIVKLKAIAEAKEGETNFDFTNLVTINHLLDPRPGTSVYKEMWRDLEEKAAKKFVQAWKVNLALFRQYGGRVIYQQAGPEPLDAYREFLREQERNGSFRILDKSYEPAFWEYFVNDEMHVFAAESREEGLEVLRTPWWLRDEPSGGQSGRPN
jgi:hypothetical protein